MNLKQISRIVVTFSPWSSGNTRSIREFIARLMSQKTRDTNPECKIKYDVRDSGDPVIEVEYLDKTVQRLVTSDLTAKEILEKVQTKAYEMETEEVLKKAGATGIKLESTWLTNKGRERDMGVVQRVPRQ